MASLLCALFFLCSPFTYAQDPGASASVGGILINADQMFRDTVKRTVKLKGHVQLMYQGYYIACDEAIIFLNTKQIEATGDVIVKTDQMQSEGRKVLFNLETKQGTFYDGFVQSGQVVFEGDVIEKVGEHEYIASKARYTACASCPADWSFTGDRIHAEIGGYARISKPVLRVFGLPIFILPGIIVPLKSSRQSGFLVPSWDYSRDGGLAISESFFWAMSRSQDMTLTAKNYEFRGPKGLVEYRYVLDPKSRGTFRTAYIPDRAFDGPTTDESYSRWFVDYHHVLELPESFSNHVKLQTMSDLRYQRDFPDEIKGQGDPAMENRISLTKDAERTHFSAEGLFYLNLLQDNPLANNDNAVHRLPEIRYSLTQTRLFDSDLLLAADFNYVNFAREGFAYDDINDTTKGDPVCQKSPGGKVPDQCLKTQRDGVFNPDRDLMRVGQRFDFMPTLSYPILLWRSLSVTPTLTYRETQYRFPVSEELGVASSFSPSAARRYLDTTLAMRTRFSHVYGNQEDPKSTLIKHEIEPSLTYSDLPWARYPNHDFFGSSVAQEYSRILEPVSDDDAFGVNGLQYDYEDRLFTKRKVDLAFTNRWVRKRRIGDEPDYLNVVTWRLWQGYDFHEARTPKPQPWSPVNSVLDIRQDHFETNTYVVRYPYAKITNTSSRVKLISDSGDFLQMAYTRSILVDENNSVLPDTKVENYGFGLGTVTRFLTLSGEVDYSNITHKVQSWKYAVVLNSPGRCWAVHFQHEQILGGDPNFRFNFAFKFDGETPSSMSRM